MKTKPSQPLGIFAKFKTYFQSRTQIIVITGIVLVCLFFFYKTVIFHQIPFPGDSLISENPYKNTGFLGYAPGGYPNKAQGRDVSHEIYPWKYFSVSQLKKGHLPFWNPYNFAGNPQMQNFQTGIFYPLILLFLVFSFPFAWSVYIILASVFSAMFMYLFLRRLSLHPVTSAIGSIAFAFSSYAVVWMEYGNIDHALLWLPLSLLLMDLFIESRKIKYALLLILAFVCSILGGYIQGTTYLIMLVFLYSLYKNIITKKISPRIFIDLFFIGVIPVLLTAFQLIPTFTFFANSTRSPYSLSQIENLLEPWYYLITIFVPDFFGNPATRNFWLPITYIERVMYVSIPLLFFAIYGIFTVEQKNKWFFFIVSIVSLLLCTDVPGVKFFYLIKIPILSTAVPTRMLCIFIFCMIILGCYGIDHWLRTKEKSKLPFFFLGIYASIWVIVSLGVKFFPSQSQNLHISLHNLFIPTTIAIATCLVFYVKSKFQAINLMILIFIIIFDLFYFFQKITPFSPIEFVYPQTNVITYIRQHAGINRFWGYGSGYVSPNFQTYDQTYSPEGDDPLHIKNYGELLGSSKNGELPDLLPRPDANIAPGYGSDDLKQNHYRQTILNLLGVKYILFQSTQNTPDATFPVNTYHLQWRDTNWHIYENEKVLPRFSLFSHFVVAKNNKDVLKKIYNTDLQSNLILFKNPVLPINPDSQGRVKLIDYQPEKVVFQTNTDGNVLLFLSDNYYKFWQGNIDGVSSPIYQADYTFRAIAVPKGIHTVTMTFIPDDFYLGLKVACVGVLLLIGYLIYIQKTRKSV